MDKFEQFMLLVLLCTCVFWMVFEYNNYKLEAIRKKRELDEKVMAALKKEYEPDYDITRSNRGVRRYRVY